MATTINRTKYCKFGSTCRRRETCSYIHPQQNEDAQNQICHVIDVPPEIYNGSLYSDYQQSYYCDNWFQYNQHPHEFHTSKQPWRKFSNRNNYNLYTSGPSTLLEQLQNEIQLLFRENVPEILSQHQSLIDEQLAFLDDLEDDDDTKYSKETTLQGLKDHHQTFEQSISELSTINPMTLEVAQWLSNRLKREIQRLKARLPIYARRQQLIDTIKFNRVTILKADTGSGKSTQVVQYLVDAGFADYGQIVCTQPRRLAARELASRVAKEFGCKVGDEVGCHVGASRPQISHRTQIRFVTDAVLLSEYQTDPMLHAYTLVLVDEVHERRIDTDLLLGAMKLCLNSRHDMKLVIMSATLDHILLSKYYDGAYVMEVPGRTFPIEDIYAMEDAENHVDEAINKVLEIHASRVPGDILVFLTGQDEIDRAIDEVTRKIDPPESALLLPLHGKLSEEDTQAVFASTDSNKQRKIIFSTNVAETSVTIEGIRHVVDSGMVKEVMWDSKRHMRILKIDYTTQSSVKQRRGRAGRTSPGKCYHLYTYDTYQSLDVCSRAEILCTQPSIAVLKLKHLNIVEDITKFDWLEPPSNNSLQEAVKCLTWLGALDLTTGKLTGLGRSMAKFGLEPMLSVMILTGQKLDCLNHILALAGMLSVVQSIWWRSKDDQSKQLSDEIKASFIRDTDPGGDFIVLLRIFLEWYALGDNKERRKAWCLKHMIRWKSMKMANNFVRDLAYQLNYKFKIHFTELNNDVIERIVRCICAGFFQNLCISNGPIRAGYQLTASTTDTVGRIHRSSTVTFAQQPPKFILYYEILNINETNFLSVICPVQLDGLDKFWLESLPRSPLQCLLESYTFVNLGPALLLSLVGKKCGKVPQFEEQLHVLFEVDHAQSKLTIWGHADKLCNAQQYFQQILNQEREKLRNELQEFEIIGSTRILLGAGAAPQLALVDDEYVKIFLKNLPKNITEEQIQEKCQLHGQVRNVTMIRRNHLNSSASVTYVDCNNARMAVAQLSHDNWNEYEIHASPSYMRTSVDMRKQNYTLKAQWYITESECNGRVVFSKLQIAQQAYQLFTRRHHFCCQLEMNSINPTIKCTWPLTPHHGHAIVNFQTVEQAQAAIEARYDHLFRLEQSRKSNTSIYVRNVPRDMDEVNLKTIFLNCTHVIMLRTRKNITMTTPLGTEDFVRELFDAYPSFQSQSIFVEPTLHDGRVIAFVQLTDEQEMRAAVHDINNTRQSIGSGPLRVTIQEQRQTKLTKKGNETSKQDEFRIKLYRLPSHVDERFLLQELNQHGLHDSLTYSIVFREKLPENYFSDRSRILAEENKKALNNLKSLFAARKDFRSEPDIEIRSPTEDGRVVAFIHFNDPREIITAINMCDALDNLTIQNIGLNQLHFVPMVTHRIVLHERLAEVINNKIEQTINSIKGHSNFSNIMLFKKTIKKDDKADVLISIRGTNIEQLYKARMLFDDLLKGLQFQLYNHSWATVLFDTIGQKLLHDVQNRTGTYIWGNWKSTSLRIFGEDQACQNAYRQIDSFIQETFSQRGHSVTIQIPKDCIRQCIQNLNAFRDLNNTKTKVVINMIKRLIMVSGDQEAVTECERKVEELLDKFKSVSNLSNEKQSIDMKNICSICSCNFDSRCVLQQCGHVFCRSCLSAYFDTFFDATISFDAFKLSCPFQQCNELCLIRDIVSVLGFERMTRLAMIAFQIYIRRVDNNLAQCMGIDCKQVYRPSQHSSMYFCDQCIKVYCVSCEVEYHTGMTCEQYKRLHEEKNDDAILEYNLGKLLFKPCPKCRTPIDKYAGCNAVKCTLCSIHFCWRCQTSDETDIHKHFTDPDSPCYNKMLDANVGAIDF